MGNAAVRASMQALAATQLSLMAESQRRKIQHQHPVASAMAVHVCKVIGSYPRRHGP